ncbi:MAG: hypothetical protein ACI35S_00610 [Anaeroplasma sp.]
MKVIIKTNKEKYEFKATIYCRYEIHKRIKEFKGPLIPLIIRAFDDGTGQLTVYCGGCRML